MKKKDFACALDILILQRQGPFPVFSPIGDLDNRIKTLIDGLRMPEQCSEVAGQSPEPDENPFFVLMDDDKTIFQLQVSADKLWVPPGPNEPENDIVAIIGVRVTTRGGNPIAYLCGEF